MTRKKLALLLASTSRIKTQVEVKLQLIFFVNKVALEIVKSSAINIRYKKFCHKTATQDWQATYLFFRL